ncbi:TnsD family Tn7-like transposition protein [Pseudomonas syringae]|uniref:TnsD family Tn7-like transposition protein n=1 Tax=Pseudomonas syringae TaxID=317 RepID=UPI003F750BEC
MATFLTVSAPRVRWLPGETFFSLCSRQHICSGSQGPRMTSERLFGLSHRSIKHDFPYGMRAFEEKTGGFWGSADSILIERTILPFFAPFQSDITMLSAIDTLKGNQLGALKYRLGLVTGGFGAEHPLKVCPECLDEDMSLMGIPYWHLAHQYPGVLICPVHGALLRECTHNRHWYGRFSWNLPSRETFRAPLLDDLDGGERALLITLGQAAVDLAAIGFKTWFEPSVVSRTYRQHVDSATSFKDHVATLRRFHPFEGLPSSNEEAEGFVANMTRKPRGRCHPIKHLLMITWLFETVQSFSEHYRLTALSMQQQRLVASTRCALVEKRSTLPPVGGALRPKKLKAPIRSQLIEQLAQGLSKHAICSAFSVTVSTVNKLLRAQPELKAIWGQARFEMQLESCRHVWNSFREEFPDKGTQALRARSPATYAWLYRNDREWLSSHATPQKEDYRRNRYQIDWAARDVQLRALIKTQLRKAYAVGPQQAPLSKSRMFSLVPNLASCLENYRHYHCSRSYVSSLLYCGKKPSILDDPESS